MQAQQPADVAALQQQQHQQQHQQQQQQQQEQQQQQQHFMDTPALGPFDPSSCRSLYIGNLQPYVSEPLLQEAFSAIGPVAEVKIIKEKSTGMSAGYGFVKYFDHRSAEVAMQTFNGRLIWNQEVRVNWAFQKDQREDTSQHCHIFVGDLSNEVNDRALFEAFQHCGDCSDARVMWDHATGRSKGYGFVSFRTQEASEKGIALMNGKLVGHRRIRCGWAQHKQSVNSLDYPTVDRADPHNCNVYVGNVSQDTSDAELRQQFSQFGTITDVKIYRKGSYGFVNFCHHAEAVNAIVTMNGQAVGDKALKCAWGRHQPRHAPMSALGLLQMQSQMQTQLGFLAPQGMLASMSPMLQMPAGMQLPSGMQMPNRLQLDGTSQLSQQAQQALQQHALLNPNMQLGPQPSATLTTQQQMLAARSLYGHGFNIYGSMYGAP